VCPDCNGRELLGLDKGEIVEKRAKCTLCRGTGEYHTLSKRLDPVTQQRRAVRKCCGGCLGQGWTMYRKVRQQKTCECNSCLGTGRRRTEDAERALALGLDVKVYARHWPKRFSWLAGGLDRIDHLEKNCLQSQLRAGITRA
jgi:hypothetical protein